ncbi:hypothetical protein FRC02_010198 [Tulasnella sp. 418]|nr:hypothetical protein FRC02_010198 [Tulasnella sp. 418]
MRVSSIISSILVISLAKAQDQPTIRNVTYYTDHPSFLYIPNCVHSTIADCHGAWWSEYDAKYGNRQVKVTGDPDQKFGSMEPYFEFTFKGTGFYVYQWMNKSATADQSCLFEGSSSYISFREGINWPYALNDESTLTLTWSKTGLKPGTHTLAIRHNMIPGMERFMVIDHIVVEELLEDINQSSSRRDANRGRIIGGAVAGTVLVLAGICLFYLFKREQAAKRRRKLQAKTISVRNSQIGRISAESQAAVSANPEASIEDQMHQVEGPTVGPDLTPKSGQLV